MLAFRIQIDESGLNGALHKPNGRSDTRRSHLQTFEHIERDASREICERCKST